MQKPYESKANRTETYDVTWSAHNNWVWTAFEAELAVATASAPALKVFVKRYFDVTRYGTYGSETYGGMTNRFSTYFSRGKRSDNTTERSRRGDMEQGEESTIGFASKDGAQDVYLSNLGKRSESTSYGSGHNDEQKDYGIHTIATAGTPEPFEDRYARSVGLKLNRSADNTTMGRAMAMEQSHLEDDSSSDSRKSSHHEEDPPISPDSTRSMSLLRKKQGSARSNHRRRGSSQNGIMVERDVQVNVERSQPGSDVEDNHESGHDGRSVLTGSTTEALHYDRSRALGSNSRVHYFPGHHAR